MKLRGVETLVVIAIALVISHAQDAQQTDWFAKSTSLPQSWDEDSKPVVVPAPNGKLTLRVVGKKTGRLYPEDELVPDYFLESAGHRLDPSIRPYASPHALWSPNSDLLSVTSSDGGLVGNWKVYVYSVEGGTVVKHDVMRLVKSDLARAFPAGIASYISRREREEFAHDPSWVNVFAVRWLSDPERLVVVASVPPSSGYGSNMGKGHGYIVEPRTGRILRMCKEAAFTEWKSVCADK